RVISRSSWRLPPTPFRNGFASVRGDRAGRGATVTQSFSIGVPSAVKVECAARRGPADFSDAAVLCGVARCLSSAWGDAGRASGGRGGVGDGQADLTRRGSKVQDTLGPRRLFPVEDLLLSSR